MRKALELHLEGMLEDGDPIPRSSSSATYRKVMKDLDSEAYFLAHVQVDPDRLPAAVGNS